MEELSHDDDWVVFTDRDVWFPHPKYGDIIDGYSKNQEYGLLTCFTNRIGNSYQCQNGKYWKVESNLEHVEIANKMFDDYGYEILDITNKRRMSGMLIMLKKSTWKSSGGFKEDGLLGVDNTILMNVRSSGGKAGLMMGVYVWHYYRNGNKKDKSHLQ